MLRFFELEFVNVKRGIRAQMTNLLPVSLEGITMTTDVTYHRLSGRKASTFTFLNCPRAPRVDQTLVGLNSATVDTCWPRC